MRRITNVVLKCQRDKPEGQTRLRTQEEDEETFPVENSGSDKLRAADVIDQWRSPDSLFTHENYKRRNK